jgi:hypothetical protein
MNTHTQAHCGSIHMYLIGFIGEPPLPSHKKRSWSLSRGKWASCRFKKLFPDPNRGAWTVPIMKWNEFSTAIAMLFSRPRQASPWCTQMFRLWTLPLILSEATPSLCWVLHKVIHVWAAERVAWPASCLFLKWLQGTQLPAWPSTGMWLGWGWLRLGQLTAMSQAAHLHLHTQTYPLLPPH